MSQTGVERELLSYIKRLTVGVERNAEAQERTALALEQLIDLAEGEVSLETDWVDDDSDRVPDWYTGG